MNDEKRRAREWLPARYLGPLSPRLVGTHPLLREMERMMQEFEEDFDYPLWPSLITSPPRFPAVDVKEEEDKYIVMADLPGLEREDVSVLMGEGMLDISAKKQKESEEEREGFIRKERGYVSFHRRLALPEDVEEEGIEAKLEDGVLRLTIPRKKKEEKDLKKRIDVK
jgi:HSP20 family protein